MIIRYAKSTIKEDKLANMDREKVASQISSDILDGVYSNYPKLMKDLAQIAYKLRISNSQLSDYQVSLLKDNEYL